MYAFCEIKIEKIENKMEIIKNPENMLPAEKLGYLQRELVNIRHEVSDNKYIKEAITVLQAGGLRSAIGSYWNAVVDDLRRKVVHRSLDLFNKEMSFKKTIKTYEDFQDHVTDHDLIEGAFKIGILSWEGKKLIHQARETRNIFDGHPDSSDPTLFKVFNMIADCNRYVLSQEYPPTIIDTNEYILNMDSPNFHKNEIAIEQAFSDLPQIYKNELINKYFTLYLQDNASTVLKSNIEFSLPILWKVLPKEDRQQIGQRFDKEVVNGNELRVEKATDFMILIDGLRYVSSYTRRVIFEPAIKELEDNLDNWHQEGSSARKLQRIGSVIPDELIERYVTSLTLSYIGYGNYYSFAASPIISEMFKRFDNTSIEAFINAVQTNEKIRQRIRTTRQLDRLRALGTVLLSETTPREDLKNYLELMIDTAKTGEFFSSLDRKKK